MTATCPHCQANLQGGEIPADSRKYYGDATHFGREIGIQIQGLYDGVLFWQCPDCGWRWHRWPEEHPLRLAAEPYVQYVR